MTDLRQAAQQALEALERADKDDFWREQRDAITALRSALEQQQAEPVSELQKRYLESEKAFQQQAEPIGWLDRTDMLAGFRHRDFKAAYEKRGSATPRDFTIPVYTDPPQRKPLSDEQIDDIWVEHGCEGEDAYGFARAIEAAHGIKEGT